jgi:hypothetical protein
MTALGEVRTVDVIVIGGEPMIPGDSLGANLMP